MPNLLRIPGILASLFLLHACGAESTGTTASAELATAAPSAATAVVDPDGEYTLFSDPAITRPPAPDLVFGKGQTLSVDYDGSKTGEGDPLFYRLYFIRPDGKVQQLADSVFENGRTRGTFTSQSLVFNSDANGRPGFVEVFVVTQVKVGTDGGSHSGKQVRLGLYPVRFEVE